MIPLRDNIKAKSFAIISWLIILANFYIFYLELKAQSGGVLEKFVNQWAVIPKNLFHEPARYGKTLVTAAFVHGGWMHILSNMLFLYIFGNNVEDRMGHFKFLIFYFIVGVTANFVQAYASAQSALPLIGASGAIAGVLGAYFFYYPHARIVTLIPIGFFITIREIPAFFFLGFWFLLQMLNGGFSHIAAHQSMGGVAWWAHAAGFVSGMILAPIFGGKTSQYR
jgi:membrane associated rhomboid family serine protease